MKYGALKYSYVEKRPSKYEINIIRGINKK
jgi:hypothetical protein